MANVENYEFKIRDFTPLTLPMARLSEYLASLSVLFGYESHVHFIMVDEGSAKLLNAIDDTHAKRVERRLLSIESGTARPKVKRAFESLNELLWEDNTAAILTTPRGKLIAFPGRDMDRDATAGPMKEVVTIDGEVIQIGGRDETISVHIRNKSDIHICTASREQGREISKYLFEGRIRVSGIGTFMRSSTGEWKMRKFVVSHHTSLDIRPLSAALFALRSISPDIDSTPMLHEVMYGD